MIQLQFYTVNGMGVKREDNSKPLDPNLKWDERVCGIIIVRLFLSRPQGNIFLHEGQVRLKFLTKIKR